MKVEIIVLNSVWCKINEYGKDVLNEELSYESTYWRQGRYRKEKVTYSKQMIERRKKKGTKINEYFFHTGLFNKAVTFFENNNIQYSIDDRTEPLSYDEPYVKGIKPRDYQKEIVENSLQHGRGVIKASTGVGKSYMILHIMSAYSQENILFLVHTKDLAKQMMDDLKKFKFGPLGEWTANQKKKGRIMVSTIQSFKKVVHEYIDYFHVVICDEVHHINSLDSTYGFVLQRLSAPVKLGTTATLPDTDGGKLCLEALIGPVLADFDMHKAAKKGVLAKPDIRIIETPQVPYELLFDTSTMKSKSPKPPSKYRVVYYNGIVNNVNRNLRVLLEAEKYVKKGESVLINIINIAHGQELLVMSTDFSISPVFINGSTCKADRDQIKSDFKNKKILCVIASTIFNEGIDLPSLNVCINAAGGKSEIATLQKIGRGLRKTKGKDTVKIIDFNDSKIHQYMRNHFNKRYTLYKENGWVK